MVPQFWNLLPGRAWPALGQWGDILPISKTNMTWPRCLCDVKQGVGPQLVLPPAVMPQWWWDTQMAWSVGSKLLMVFHPTPQRRRGLLALWSLCSHHPCSNCSLNFWVLQSNSWYAYSEVRPVIWCLGKTGLNLRYTGTKWLLLISEMKPMHKEFPLALFYF